MKNPLRFASSMHSVQGIAGRDYTTPSDPAFPVDGPLNDEGVLRSRPTFWKHPGPAHALSRQLQRKSQDCQYAGLCTNAPLIDSTVTFEAERVSPQ